MSTPATTGKMPGLPTLALPQVLKDAGWKLERKIVNDDDEHPQFSLRNEKLGLQTQPAKDLDAAIEGALVLQTRSEGKKVSRAKIKEEVKEMVSGVRGQGSAGNSQEISNLPLVNIRTDGGTQPRGELDQDVVDGYADDMKAGAKFPPVDVFYDGTTYWLADGFHRFFATKQTSFGKHSGGPTIAAVVHQGTKRDAILYSLGANAEHGFRRSNADKRRAVMKLLEDKQWSMWSNGFIADKAKVSHTYVKDLRKELDRTRNVSSSTKRIGKDNRVRETRAIGGKKKAEPPASAGGSSVGDFKVTDKRRLTEEGGTGVKGQGEGVSANAGGTPAVPGAEAQVNDGEQKAAELEKMLNGRMLSVAFTWIPNVPGVDARVNASTDREKGQHKLLKSSDVPRMSSVVIEMIAAALGEAKPSPTSKVQSPKSKKKRPSAAQAALNKHKARKAALKRFRAAKKKPAKKR